VSYNTGVALHTRDRRDAVSRTVHIDAKSLTHTGRIVVRMRSEIANVVEHP
jgi:hypothetical protein